MHISQQEFDGRTMWIITVEPNEPASQLMLRLPPGAANPACHWTFDARPGGEVIVSITRYAEVRDGEW